MGVTSRLTRGFRKQGKDVMPRPHSIDDAFEGEGFDDDHYDDHDQLPRHSIGGGKHFDNRMLTKHGEKKKAPTSKKA